jgi:hypothetical protein
LRLWMTRTIRLRPAIRCGHISEITSGSGDDVNNSEMSLNARFCPSPFFAVAMAGFLLGGYRVTAAACLAEGGGCQ